MASTGFVRRTKSLSTARGCATPEWPHEALRYEIEGVTTIHFEIDASGNVARPVVRKSSGWKLLDDAAMRGLSKCQFLPNLEEARDGRPFPIQYVWKLGGDDVVLHPLLVPDSCGKSARFAVEYVRSCRFAIDPEVEGTRTDTLFGRVLVNPDSATGNSVH